jgi:Kdo2-lipid IVA lauroyltransferase/acyltransferase
MYYVVYSLLWIFSLLPFRVLHFIGDGFYGIAFYILKYRRDVVMSNLRGAFPEKTDAERLQIAKQFYHNFIDTMMESIKFISISRKQIEKRSTGEFELLHQLIAGGKNINLMAGHQFNWEFANLLYSMNLPVPFVGVYMLINNKILNKIFFNIRKSYGTILVSAQEFKDRKDDLMQGQYVLALAADQNPGDPSNAYWTNYFGRPAPFVTGPAKNACRNNFAVAIVGFSKKRRGYYHFTTTLITEDASRFTPVQLTILYKNALEKIIRQDPANYLWSHRRWKYEWKPEYGEILQ